MATVKITPYAYSQDTDLQNLCNYVIDPYKTSHGYYTFGRGLETYSAFENIVELQELYGKTTGHRAYHIIVSFDPKYAFCSEDALILSYTISNYFFPSYQVLCGVHPYQDVLHAHFAVNTVSLDPAITQKLHIGPATIYDLLNKVNELERTYANGNTAITA